MGHSWGEVTQDSVKRVVDLLQASAVGEAGWEQPLEALAETTGSTSGQLIGLGDATRVPFNLMTGLPPETGDDFVAAGGGDPAINSRVRMGARAKPLEVLDESAFTTASDMRLHPEYARWIETYDIRHACLTPLVKEPAGLVGLALLRSGRQGNVDQTQKRAFAVIAAHARGAVRTQLALESQELRLLVGSLEAARTTAYLCDQNGRLRAMTSSAEAFAAPCDVLRLSYDVLSTACEADRPRFEEAFGAVALGGSPARCVGVRRLRSDERVFIEIAPLPASFRPVFAARVLVVVRQAAADEARVALAAQALFGLSRGEAAIAAALAAGRSPTAVAAERRVSLGTVRSQVRRIYAKLGVTTQLELAARLPRL